MKALAFVLVFAGNAAAGVMTFGNNAGVVVADVNGQNITPASVTASTVTISNTLFMGAGSTISTSGGQLTISTATDGSVNNIVISAAGLVRINGRGPDAVGVSTRSITQANQSAASFAVTNIAGGNEMYFSPDASNGITVTKKAFAGAITGGITRLTLVSSGTLATPLVWTSTPGSPTFLIDRVSVSTGYSDITVAQQSYNTTSDIVVGGGIGSLTTIPTQWQLSITTINAKATSAALTVNTSAYLGINVTNPSTRLTVRGPEASPPTSGSSGGGGVAFGILQIDNVTDQNSVAIGNYVANTGSWIQSANEGNFALAGLPLAINPLGGNVGISTGSPQFALDVAGAIHSSSATVIFDGNTAAFISSGPVTMSSATFVGVYTSTQVAGGAGASVTALCQTQTIAAGTTFAIGGGCICSGAVAETGNTSAPNCVTTGCHPSGWTCQVAGGTGGACSAYAICSRLQ